jgi:outer membrane murein-binding lipoprotein Lpp
MMIAMHTSQGIQLAGYAMLVVVSTLWIAGCATNKAELMQEIGVLLRQTQDEVQQQTNRMDMEIAQLRSEVGQLHAVVGQVDSKVGRMGSEVGQLGSEVALLQVDVNKNGTSMVDLARRVNQPDQHVVKSDRQSPSNGERASERGDVRVNPGNPKRGTDAVASPSTAPSKTLKYGMSQQEILSMYGNPHSTEKILDSIYWYYADGEIEGQYVRFDATTGYVNGWSTSSPQHIQIDLRATHKGTMP